MPTGTIRAVGELSDIDHLVIDTTVDRLTLKLFDYPVRNEGPIKLALDRHTLEVQRFRLVGEGTALELSGNIALHDNRIALEASGDANLGILQGFFRDIRSSGNASLHAQMQGPFDAPVFSGEATIADGRLRYMTLPHSLQSVKGKLSFDAQGIRIDDMTGELGAGPVRLGGRVGIKGYAIDELSLTATGEQMHLRYPEGFRSIVDATLELRGTLSSPVLRGTVIVRDGLYAKRFEPNVDVFNLGGAGAALPSPAAEAGGVPVRFDIQVQAPQTLRVENNLAHLVASADLTLTGTYDRPVLLGRAEIVRGEIFFEGNRYLVTRGTIDFLNAVSIEPFFDIEAETRVRVPSETYRVTLAVSGTFGGHMNLELNSDPPLPAVDIISLLFGQTTDVGDAELRALRPQAATQSEEALLRAALARFATAPIVGPVGRAVEQTFGVDLVQLSPSLGTANDPLTPTARLTIGKRLSNRAYFTYARALGTTIRDQIIVLEYDQSERVGWVLTQTSDRQFSVDFRVRRSF